MDYDYFAMNWFINGWNWTVSVIRPYIDKSSLNLSDLDCSLQGANSSSSPEYPVCGQCVSL